MKNQQAKVLNHLKQGLTLSQADAISLYDCYRLSPIIHCLRNSGYRIVTHIEKNNRNKGTHARYELIQEVAA
ncbi:helix-turn-helix domain-containing protein [Acinetobacter lwoffii]|uniref:helix-turn-helix domain-containing protein n=1 Tax=Acinetobacter lwoffii TaxID=28090 RepID=UPI00300AE1DD